MIRKFEKHMKNRYGSKRGLVRYYKYRIYYWLGFYKKYRVSPISGINRLVFVCSGNICRSPLAENVAKMFNVDSASFGLSTRGNDSADQRAIEYGSKIGADLSSHRTTPVSEFLFRPGDLLVLVEPDHLLSLHEMKIDYPCVLLGLYSHVKTPYLHDPYNANSEYFECCSQLVAEAVKALVCSMELHCEK